MAEINYAFRRRLNQVHRPNRARPGLTPGNGEVAVRSGWAIVIAPDASDYLVRVAQDLQDYFLTSLGVSLLLERDDLAAVLARAEAKAIVLGTCQQVPGLGCGLKERRSFRLVAKRDAIVVCGCDERGVGQGAYHIEDVMNLREAPFMTMGDTVREPLFQPRMVHSGWGIDQFPDAHLNAIAHAGMDAILVFVKGPNRTTTGHLDLNNLVDRAALYGLDVYLYSYLHSTRHPDDPDAEAFYESTYGALIRSCPGARGIVFVGESCEFPSKDERTRMRTRHCPVPPGGEDDRRPFPGWWPCRDYPRWLGLIKKVIRRASPQCDIVFWTYNWGWAPVEPRLALIEALPTDISLQVTFEMFENIRKDGVMTRCVDYTASFEGPGQYFSTEAKAAHDRGIPLYAMANTGGLTWDIGVIPYQPIPFQWKRRYDALHRARQDWGLRGLMESHHFGWWPSPVSELAKWSYWKPQPDFDAMAAAIARRDVGAEAAPYLVAAWRAWSDAFRNYVPTNEDQYGPFRVGPSYPLAFLDEAVAFPSADYAHFGSRILTTRYRSHAPADVEGEIGLLERLEAGWTQGLESMREAVERTPPEKQAQAQETLRLGQFIRLCVRTTIHVKRWFLLGQVLRDPAATAAAKTPWIDPDVETAANRRDPAATADAKMAALDAKMAALDAMTALAQAEIANAREAIPLVEADSRLGWEPSMEYMTDREHLEWKIRQVYQVIDEAIPAYRRSLKAAT
ncbi:MAG: hypothetical protein GX595_14350 [Lentisphaerae bacterium]|nr:hypothetical protein [Lentisphaerota bacterium]